MLSVTMLSSYLYCSRKLYLQRVLGLWEPPKEAMVKGTIRHETYDLINKNEERIVKSIKELNLEKIKEKYKYEYLKFLRVAILKNKEGLAKFEIKPEEMFKKVYPMINDEAETRAFNIFTFIQKNNLFGDELWEKLTPKIQSELKVTSEVLGLKGIIDQIEVYSDGNSVEYVPIELKTGKAPREGVWPGHKIQLAAYCLLLEGHYKKQIKEGFITYLDIKDRRHIAMNAFLKDEVKELIDKVNDLLNSKELPDFCGSENKCKICGLRDDCYNETKMKKMLEKNSNI